MPNEALYEAWGERLRAERHRQGLTQGALASRSGVSQQMLSALERGMTGVGDDTRRALASALSVRPVDLFPYPEDLSAEDQPVLA